MATDEPPLHTKILLREVMNSPVITAGPDASIREIAEKMTDFRVGSVVIMEGGEPVGIVTDGDIVQKVVAKDLLPSSMKAEEVMSKPLHTIDAEKDVTEAAKLLRRLGVKRLGVTYKGKVVGIISVSDLIAITPELVEIISEKAKMSSSSGLVERRGYLSGYCDACSQWSDYLQQLEGKYLCEECRGEIGGGQS